jgi:hypothetical protein
MKTWITTVMLLFALTIFGQGDCSKYYPFGEGTVSEFESYDRKGKLEAKMKYTVNNVSHTGGATTATVNSELFDKKGQVIMTNEFDMRCDGSTVTMDFKSLMNSARMQQFQNGEATITGTNVEIPNTLTPEQTLADASVNITMDMGGMKMNMETRITDRKVIGMETITTPAGTFKCVAITQTSQVKMMVANQKGIQKTWLAEGVGMVKNEYYNANGKLQGTTVLMAFSK